MEKLLARKRGFTLIELIIVIAIIAIIVAAVFVAMDPVKRLNSSRNARRNNDATGIAQALNLAVTDKQVAGTDLLVNTVLKAANASTVATTVGCTGGDGCVGDWFMIGGTQNPTATPYVDNTAASRCTLAFQGYTAGTGALGIASAQPPVAASTVCGGVLGATIRTGCLNLQTDLISGYLSSIPRDPSLPSTSVPSGYLVRYGSGAYWVRNCKPEAEGAGGTGTPPTIEVSR